MVPGDHTGVGVGVCVMKTLLEGRERSMESKMKNGKHNSIVTSVCRENLGHLEIININVQTMIPSGWFQSRLGFNFTLYFKTFYSWHLFIPWEE